MIKRISLMLLVLTLFLMVGTYAADPGTDGDPLITKSFIDSVVYPYINTKTEFKVVDVPANKSVICSAGTELILRMGACTAIGTQKGGISDVTLGYDLANGTMLQGNHHIIVPLDDGRGVKTINNCLIMIKGQYQIK